MLEWLNALFSAGGLKLPDKRVDPDCWLKTGFESPRRQLGFKPLSRSYQLQTLHYRVTLIWASFGRGANNIQPFSMVFFFIFSSFFFQIHLDTMPEMIAKALRSQLQPELDTLRPVSGPGGVAPAPNTGPRPLSEFTGMRRFAGTSRQRRPFQTQASFGGFSNVQEHQPMTTQGGGLLGPPMLGSDSQL